MNRILGIDLGTSTSEIAFINNDGNVELIPNDFGEYITPSVVHIKEDGEVVVGIEAKEQIILNPESTFMEVKRLMGQDIKLKCHNKSYSPVEMTSYILNYLIECASSYLNEEITQAVITVPAYFTDAQRKDTIKAGELCGIKVERIINEPTAASLDYGIMNMDECKNILIYDFGGGTLDVTVMELFEGVIDVKSSCGNNSLGGKDFDQALMDYIVNEFKSKYKIDLSKDLRSMVRIKQAAEECKIALSNVDEFNIDLPFLAKSKGNPIGFSETISRDLFESLILEKVKSTAKQVKTALLDANLSVDELDLVLLVGGTTKIPLIANFLRDELGLNPESLIDPDLGVVHGAAIQAGIMNDEFKNTEKEIIITDVCPYSLSTSVLEDMPFGGSLFCDILIERNTTIPTSTHKVYYTCSDYQDRVEVDAYQGESTVPEENFLLGKFILAGIPPARAGKEKIKIAFSYDVNGILNVQAEILSNGKNASIEIDTRSSSTDLDLETWKDASNAKKYRSVIRKVEKMIDSIKNEDKKGLLKDKLDELKQGIVKGLRAELLDDLKDDILDLIDLLEGSYD